MSDNILPPAQETDAEKIARHADELTLMLAERHDYQNELIGAAADDGQIINISDADGEYLYTLTITRTPGY